MQVFKEGSDRERIFLLKEMPFAFTNKQGNPGVTYYLSDDECYIGCLGCVNPRCMYFSEEEIECDYVAGFPNDKSVNACPVDAISWDNTLSAPKINHSRCISCGICVSRCPVGALYFSEKGKLKVNTIRDRHVECTKVDHNTQMVHLEQIEQMVKKPRLSMYLHASDQVFAEIYDKLFRLKSNYHNAVGRNLLIALGCKCSMRRVGDVYTRMDAVYSSAGGTFGAVEIEFGRDTLDASRGILDDIAVLNTRYGISKQNNKPLVICLQLPNARQGYWQVVRDIMKVEGIKIETITIGALMYLLWGGYTFEPENDRYYIDYDNMNLRSIICYQADCDRLPVTYKELGIFEPMK